MDENKKKIIVEELTMLLIYLTGWEENGSRQPFGMKIDGPGKEKFKAYHESDPRNTRKKICVICVIRGFSFFILSG